MSDEYAEGLGGLGEQETLARLTVEEKRRIAGGAVTEFPELSHQTLDGWFRAHGGSPERVGRSASVAQKADALLDWCETLVRSREDPEALDRFIYGYLFAANLESHGIDPAEVAAREPLDAWEGVYGLD